MVMNRKVASRASKVDPKKAEDATDEDTEEEETQIVAVEKPKPEQEEKETVDKRTKELKSLSVGELKDLVASKGLTTGKKEDMIKALLKCEAKERAAVREHEGKIRAVVLKKKEELEIMPASELSKLCDSMALKGFRSKQDRIGQLLRKWQESDGVDKSLAQMAQDARKIELEALDDISLRKLCDKVGVDPFVKEVMVERISKHEKDAHRYEKPLLEPMGEESVTDAKVDMVEALLANETRRQQEKQLRTKQEEAVTSKRKELKSMSIDELKSALAKKGVEPVGKKDDLVEVLFLLGMQQDALKARKSELKSLGLQELKNLLVRKGLEADKKMDAMVDIMLKYEAKCRQDLEAFNVKGREVLSKKKEELLLKSNSDLKEMCASNNLALGGGKEERAERLLEEIQNSGEVEKAVAVVLRSTRKEELMGFDKPTLLKLCEAAGADPYVKNIMVERIVVQESEMGSMEPAAKKARHSKK